VVRSPLTLYTSQARLRQDIRVTRRLEPSGTRFTSDDWDGGHTKVIDVRLSEKAPYPLFDITIALRQLPGAEKWSGVFAGFLQ